MADKIKIEQYLEKDYSRSKRIKCPYKTDILRTVRMTRKKSSIWANICFLIGDESPFQSQNVPQIQNVRRLELQFRFIFVLRIYQLSEI